MFSSPESVACSPRPIPARAGIGLRAQHHDDLLRERPNVGWLEAHSENYFADGGAQIEHLLKLRELYPLSLHGVGLSLGSTDPLDREHLRRLKRLMQLSEPGFVSEHLCWASVNGTYLNDLLPLPYTEEALTHMIARVGEAQDYLGRRILIENVSSYLEFSDSEMQECEFLTALATKSGCGLLLDVNNIYVSSRNHGFDARDFLARIPRGLVCEMHLAGHSVNRYEDIEILIDTHSAPVCEDVWNLYSDAIARFGDTPTLIEWDADIPALEVLAAEAARADAYLRGERDIAA
ncbi:MAG TPA: DUF692 domain-containing protein [Steroidobacter sp.]|jgi:uncharacterized protein|nr:DUF692 domain-containing protein [Steroidobacter sp.]